MDSTKHLLFFVHVLAVQCLANLSHGSGASSKWSYSNVSAWRNDFPKCGGKRQSPIDILDSDAVVIKTPVELHFNNYNVSIDDVDLRNNGKTAKFENLLSRNITLAGQGMYLHGNYSLAEVHFHWGPSGASGSEHKINGKSSPLEVHFIHFNLVKYSRVSVAMRHPDGVLVLSVLTEASKNATFNNIWKNIGTKLDVIHKPGEETKFSNLLLQNIIPRNVGDYYMYRGSFTTPPCYQTVTWIVLREKLQIFDEHLESFRAMQASVNNTHIVTMLSNNRPVQPLNSRPVLKTFHSPGDKNSQDTMENVIGGHEVIAEVKVYPCYLPPSVSLSIIIPSLDINWKSSNLSTDLNKPKVLNIHNSYSVTMEMHDHPRGLYKDKVHVTVKLIDSKLTNEVVEVFKKYVDFDKKCLPGSCKWTSTDGILACPLRLIDSDDTLTFTLAQQNLCDHSYSLAIKKQRDVIFSTTLTHNKRVHLNPMGVDQRLHATLRKWYLVLFENETSEVDNVKVFLDIPETVLAEKVLVMQGDYVNARKCQQKGGIAHHTKIIVGVVIGVFLVGMVVLVVVLVNRRCTKKHRPTLLVDELELNPEKV